MGVILELLIAVVFVFQPPLLQRSCTKIRTKAQRSARKLHLRLTFINCIRTKLCMTKFLPVFSWFNLRQSLDGIRRVAPYSARKSGVAGVTRSLAVEWAAEGICVNCLTPGYIETDLTRHRFDDPAFSTAFHNRVPMGQRGSHRIWLVPLYFLPRPASDCLTGQRLVVDRGYLIA
jgi:NAD(P)-dependent dehydrogenase (short-subunit alcohol dehydrogenase family)